MIVPDFDKDTTLLAVFDGHGGEAHVAFCACLLHTVCL